MRSATFLLTGSLLVLTVASILAPSAAATCSDDGGLVGLGLCEAREQEATLLPTIIAAEQAALAECHLALGNSCPLHA